MGRKKKKPAKPWCWYCNREFDDEKILIQHQKAKHFKCHICHRKLYTGPGLAIHTMQVHKENIDKIPNALPDRNSVDIEIYGMEGIPEQDLREHERQTGTLAYVPPPNSEKKPTIEAQAALAVAAGLIPHPPGLPPPVPSTGLPYAIPNFPPPSIGHPPQIPLPGSTQSQAYPGYPPHLHQPPPNMPPPPGLAQYNPNIPPPVSMMPPTSMMAQPPVSYTSTANLPNKPLFPSAALGDAHGGPALSYSSPALISKSTPAVPNAIPGLVAPTPIPSSSATTASGSASKIVHPEEDLSLEELRARQFKYKLMIQPNASPTLQGSSTTAPAGAPASELSSATSQPNSVEASAPPAANQFSNPPPPISLPDLKLPPPPIPSGPPPPLPPGVGIPAMPPPPIPFNPPVSAPQDSTSPNGPAAAAYRPSGTTY